MADSNSGQLIGSLPLAIGLAREDGGKAGEYMIMVTNHLQMAPGMT